MKSLFKILMLFGVFMQIALVGQPQPVFPDLPVEGRVTVDEQRQVQQALQDWAGDLHRRLAEDSSESLCFSPTSIAAVLGMIIKGMPEGAERTSVMEALKLQNLSQDRLHLVLGTLFQESVSDENPVIDIANAVGVNTVINDSYRSGVEELYGAEVFDLGDDAAQTINDWVAKHTHDMIKEILSKDEDLSQLKAALMNAVYFKGKWDFPFDGKGTYKQTFTCADGLEVEKMMMHQTARYNYYEGVGYKMLEKKFAGDKDVSFVVFLPDDLQGLGALEKQLGAQLIESSRSMASYRKVVVTLPKMDIDFGVDKLMEHFEAMGFDLKGTLTEIGDDAFLSKIIHKAKLKVYEDGAEGAAATVATVCECTLEPKPPVFDARHPFVYAIMIGDNILFQGSVKDGKALLDD